MNSSSHTLKASCWKCREIFTVIARPADLDQASRLVQKIVPCPYCAASCQLTLREDQVFSEVISRGAGESAAPRLTWAEQNEKEHAMPVHPTTPASSGESTDAPGTPRPA